MLEKIVDWLHLPTDASIDRRLRNRRLRELRQYAVENGLVFYPELVQTPPHLSEDVNRYIEQKAREDLPEAQFRKSIKVGTLEEWAKVMSEWVEIGGILGYGGSTLFEMNYLSPDPRNVSLELIGIGAHFRTSTRLKSIYPQDLQKAESIIDWHSHPDGVRDLSQGDLKHINGAIPIFGNKEVYFVVYTPLDNQTHWYKAQPLQKSK